jgi:hypothetical protein
MTGAAPRRHEAIHRRAAPALFGLPAVLLAGGLALVLAVRHVGDAATLLTVVAVTVGLAIVATVMVGLAVFRVHAWTIEAGGLRIEERPKVPLTGLRRRAVVPFGDIAGLARVQSGADAQIELTVRGGARYVLSQSFHEAAQRGDAAAAATLEAFAAALVSAIERAGHPRPAVGEALGVWNRAGGLAAQAVLLVLAVALAAAVLWSVWLEPPGRPRTGWVLAVLVLLPVGMGWLLRRSLQRRRAVLAARAITRGR